MPNGAEIYIGAADANEQEMRKLLGQKYRRVCIDEAQDWKSDLHELVYSVLKPACADLRGSISLRGTPGRLTKSFFRKLTPVSVQAGIKGAKGTFPGWSLHCWDTTANTAMMPTGRRMCEQWADEIAELKRTHPGIEETPAFRRNYLGEWVLDESQLVYRYTAGKNDFDGKLPAMPPRGRWHHVLGIDLGYNDATAFVVWAYHDFDRRLFGREARKERGLDITAVATRAKALVQKYDAEATIVDGSNKQAVAEMVNRHDLPLVPADKTGKADFIELMNADFIVGHILLDPKACACLADEYGALVWNDKSVKREEHPACENHAADAALYGWRKCYQFLAESMPPPPPPVGTPEWAAQEAKAMEEQAMQELEDRQAANEAAGWSEWQ
jgi:hypothetical protein